MNSSMNDADYEATHRFFEYAQDCYEETFGQSKNRERAEQVHFEILSKCTTIHDFMIHAIVAYGLFHKMANDFSPDETRRVAQLMADHIVPIMGMMYAEDIEVKKLQ